VIIDEEGYVLTNVHVVEDATEIMVTLSDKRSYPADLVIGTRKSDVALLKIRAKPGESLCLWSSPRMRTCCLARQSLRWAIRLALVVR
jgi:S1-C subfamily serine protease